MINMTQDNKQYVNDALLVNIKYAYEEFKNGDKQVDKDVLIMAYLLWRLTASNALQIHILLDGDINTENMITDINYIYTKFKEGIKCEITSKTDTSIMFDNGSKLKIVEKR